MMICKKLPNLHNKNVLIVFKLLLITKVWYKVQCHSDIILTLEVPASSG